MTEVCEAIGVTARTFYNCCKQDLGMSAHYYLSLRWLHQAHWALRMAVVPAAAIASTAPRSMPAQSDKPSIAVLAFNNMSGDPEREYFSDRISEDTITVLSKLRVIAREQCSQGASHSGLFEPRGTPDRSSLDTCPTAFPQ